MKKVLYFLSFSLMLTSLSCRLGEADEPITPIIDPLPLVLVERDSISAGGYLGIQINENAKESYTIIQSLLKAKGVPYLNIVGNVSSDLGPLQSRIPLYNYIVLDKSEGTDSGVQITLEAGKIKAIYLTSGEKLSQWPKKENAKSSIRLGDEAGVLHEKLVRIREIKQYTATFERISLLTKDLSTVFDPGMAQSPQWYFAYTNEDDLFEVVKVYLTSGKISSIGIERYKK